MEYRHLLPVQILDVQDIRRLYNLPSCYRKIPIVIDKRTTIGLPFRLADENGNELKFEVVTDDEACVRALVTIVNGFREIQVFVDIQEGKHDESKRST